jgi:hypothetical protein
MKDELIKFETAKLSKEKGFNEDCGWLLHKDNDGSYTNCDDLGYNQPTQSLLQRWLREVHDIHIIIESSNQVGVKHNFYNYLIWLRYESFDVYKTYEEALEVGLIKALELL